MKKAIFIFIILLFCPALAEIEEPNIIKELKNSIRQLDVQITNLLRIIEFQKKEITYLRKLCSEAGIDVTPVPAGISEPIFGIYLGETLETLRTRLKVSKGDYAFADKNFRGQVWSVENNDRSIKRILAYTFNEQIYEIDIEFADTSATNCEATKTQLSKNYQTIHQNTFETIIDGVNIGIELNCYNSGGKDNRLTLTYIHVPILTQIYAELGKTKSK